MTSECIDFKLYTNQYSEQSLDVTKQLHEGIIEFMFQKYFNSFITKPNDLQAEAVIFSMYKLYDSLLSIVTPTSLLA